MCSVNSHHQQSVGSQSAVGQQSIDRELPVLFDSIEQEHHQKKSNSAYNDAQDGVLTQDFPAAGFCAKQFIFGSM